MGPWSPWDPPPLGWVYGYIYIYIYIELLRNPTTVPSLRSEVQGNNAVFHVEVVNALGQVIYFYQGEVATHDIDLTREKNGVYLVRVSQGGKQYVERIVMQ